MNGYVKNYPRPQLVRKDWVLLDGPWDFSFDDQNQGEKIGWQMGFEKEYTIQVPYTYETSKSGIGDETHHTQVWYSRTLQVRDHEGRVLLHFEGSDYQTRVFVNGQMVGEHFGGYARFSFDITDYVQPGDNLLTVHVSDSKNRSQPRGKQRWLDNSYTCFYVQTTGIWKSVWMEYVPQSYIQRLKLTPQLHTQSVKIELFTNAQDGAAVMASAAMDGITVGMVSGVVKEGRATLQLCVTDLRINESGVRTWTPEHPDLYDLEISMTTESAEDEVQSYFGLREVSIRGNQVLLNGAVLYQRLILDQGYWKDTHLTPPSEAALVEDIEKILQLGYNGVRKHMKTEDERFLYWCDVKGLLVWSEFPATFRFDDEAVQRFTTEWIEVVLQNYNHPAIITWTPFNESWGVPEIGADPMQQSLTEGIYKLTKSIDPMRPVVCNDGWRHTISDIVTLHDYEEDGQRFLAYYRENKDAFLRNEVPFNTGKCFFAFADGYTYRGQPVIISEFGGIALNNDDSGWGYGNKVEGEEAFLQRFASITGAIRALDFCCGYCYTQVTDVQQEINGLMDIDRNFKIDPLKIAAINKA